MPSTSNIPPLQFTTTGVVLPAESAILAGAQTDIDTAFGGGSNPALNTPQGQIASSESAIVADKNSQIAYICNQIDPQYASGRFQDAIGRFYMMTRQGATSTQVTAILSGTVGARIPAGTLAQDTSNNTYTLMATVPPDSGGTALGLFQNILPGPIPCPDNTLNVVYQAVIGWDAVNNPTLAGPHPSASLGRNVETRAEFEYRRQNSVAANGHGITESIYGALFGELGVTDCYCYDNASGAIVYYGATNYPLAPHSFYAAVEGGADMDVASAIWSKKDVGASYSAWPNWPGGSTVPGDGTVMSVEVADSSGYNYPPPSYMVSFIRPAALPILFAVSIVNSSYLPSNTVTLIKNAIIARFNGTDGRDDSTIERIGSMILATRYFVAVAGASANVQILSVLIGTSTPTLTSVLVGIDQTPTITAGNITVTLV